MRFDYGPKYDEFRYAKSIVEHLGLQDVWTVIDVTPEMFKESLDKAIKIYGKSTTHFSLVPLYILMKTINEEKGDVTILSGEGPDEYLGGYARQIIFDEILKWYSIPELRNYHGLIDRIFHGIDTCGVDKKLSLAAIYVQLLGYGVDRSIKWIDKNMGKGYPFHGLIGKMDMELGHIEEMEQVMAKAFNVNLIYPYIDDKFAEYCYYLPDNLKIRNGVTKWAFKEVAHRYLPETLRGRNKMGGPVFPVNRVMGWDKDGEFNKQEYLKYQERILNATKSK